MIHSRKTTSFSVTDLCAKMPLALRPQTFESKGNGNLLAMSRRKILDKFTKMFTVLVTVTLNCLI